MEALPLSDAAIRRIAADADWERLSSSISSWEGVRLARDVKISGGLDEKGVVVPDPAEGLEGPAALVGSEVLIVGVGRKVVP